MNPMSKKYSFYPILMICLLAAVTGYSQSLLGLKYPYGIPYQSGTGLSLSMGGTGIAVSNDLLGMAENPANLGAIKRAVFSLHSSLDLTNFKDGSKETNHITFNPHVLSFCFPIKKFGTIGLSVTQTSNTDAKFKLDSLLSTNGLSETEEIGLVREGSSIVWQAGWGYSINKYVLIGLAYQRMYFNPSISKIRRIKGDFSANNNDSTAIDFSTNGITGGIQVPIKNLTLGLSGQYFFENDANLYKSEDGSTIGYTMRPAPSLGFGASYQISPEWLCAADFETVLWDKCISIPDTSVPKYDVENAFGFSIGGQYIPAPNLLSPKYYEILRYRAGFRYNQLPVSTASEFGFSFGLGLPLREGNGLFDVFFEYGQRHDSKFKDTKEEFFKIQIGINGGRKWYQSTDTNY